MTNTIRLGDVGTILEYTVVDELGTPQDISSVTVKQIIFTKPDNTFVSKDMAFSTSGIDGKVQYILAEGDIDQQGLWVYKVFIDSPSGHWTSIHYNFLVEDDSYSNLISYIPDLRLRLGDTNPATYRYMDEWLMKTLILAVRSLGRYWRNKYKTSYAGDLSRSSNTMLFTTTLDEGVVESQDQPLISLMGAIIVMEGSLENSAWDAVSWKDTEIAFSNLESFRSKDSNLGRLITELRENLISPKNRLARPRKGSLYGYKHNVFEHEIED